MKAQNSIPLVWLQLDTGSHQVIAPNWPSQIHKVENNKKGSALSPTWFWHLNAAMTGSELNLTHSQCLKSTDHSFVWTNHASVPGMLDFFLFICIFSGIGSKATVSSGFVLLQQLTLVGNHHVWSTGNFPYISSFNHQNHPRAVVVTTVLPFSRWGKWGTEWIQGSVRPAWPQNLSYPVVLGFSRETEPVGHMKIDVKGDSL